MSITFYDREGNPVVYSDDHRLLFLFTGEPVGYFVDDSIYSFHGKHLGRYWNGWVRDDEGRCVFFTKSASFGPSKPTMKTPPTKHTKKSIPVPTVPEIPPFRPVDRLSWSPLSGPQFFRGSARLSAATMTRHR